MIEVSTSENQSGIKVIGQEKDITNGDDSLKNILHTESR